MRRSLKHLGVETAHNRAWKSGGLVSSLKAGLAALPEHVSAALILPSGASHIQPRLIYQLMSAYARCDGDFIAPRQANAPGRIMLVSRRYWHDMLSLPPHCDVEALIKRFEADISWLDLDAAGVVLGMSPARHASRLPASVNARSL